MKSRESLEAIRGYMEHFSCGAIRYHEASDCFVIVFEDEADLKIARQAFGEMIEEIPAPAGRDRMAATPSAGAE